MDAPTIIDWPQLLMLRDLQDPGEPDVVAELIAMFLADSAERMSRVQEAARAGDVRAIGLEAHALKGSAALLGAEHLRLAAGEVEARARTDGMEAMGPPVDMMRLSLETTLRALADGPNPA